MNKTRVDDMLIEMIEPKIQEINEKFSKGDRLTQDDINTLLLKSQYNHINHLDDKLNETVESVKNLEHKFDKLEESNKRDFERLEETYKKDFESLEQTYKKDFESLEQTYKKDFERLEESNKKDFDNLRKDFENLKVDMEATIQKSLNKNMMMLVTIIGIFLTIFKVIDLFHK